MISASHVQGLGPKANHSWADWSDQYNSIKLREFLHMWRRKLSLSRVKISNLNIFIHSFVVRFLLIAPSSLFVWLRSNNKRLKPICSTLPSCVERMWIGRTVQKVARVRGLEICGRSRVKLLFSLMKNGTKLVLLLLSVRDLCCCLCCMPPLLMSLRRQRAPSLFLASNYFFATAGPVGWTKSRPEWKATQIVQVSTEFCVAYLRFWWSLSICCYLCCFLKEEDLF